MGVVVRGGVCVVVICVRCAWWWLHLSTHEGSGSLLGHKAQVQAGCCQAAISTAGGCQNVGVVVRGGVASIATA